MHGKIYIADALELDHPLNRGLVSRWMALPDQQRGVKFRDLRGRNDGTLTNGPTWVGANRRGGYGALKFDGTNDYCVVTGFPNLAGSELTIAFTIQANSASGFPVIVRKSNNIGPPVTAFSVALFEGSGDVIWEVYTSSVQGVIPSYSVVSSAFLNVLCTFKAGTDLRVYVNGVSVGSATPTGGDMVDSGPAITMSRSGETSSFGYLNGSLDDVCVFKRYFSAREASQFHQEQLRGSPETLRWVSRKSWSIPAAAASFQAAWARNCNTYIGAGRA